MPASSVQASGAAGPRCHGVASAWRPASPTAPRRSSDRISATRDSAAESAVAAGRYPACHLRSVRIAAGCDAPQQRPDHEFRALGADRQDLLAVAGERGGRQRADDEHLEVGRPAVADLHPEVVDHRPGRVLEVPQHVVLELVEAAGRRGHRHRRGQHRRHRLPAQRPEPEPRRLELAGPALGRQLGEQRRHGRDGVRGDHQVAAGGPVRLGQPGRRGAPQPGEKPEHVVVRLERPAGQAAGPGGLEPAEHLVAGHAEDGRRVGEQPGIGHRPFPGSASSIATRRISSTASASSGNLAASRRGGQWKNQAGRPSDRGA